MNKQEYLGELSRGLLGLPQETVAEQLAFYSEMIDDRMEDGCAEAEAVAELEPVEEITSRLLSDVPLTKLVKEKIKPERRLNPIEIVLLVLGSPIWLSLLLAGLAVALSLYFTIWALIITLWAGFGALAGSALCGIGAGICFLCRGQWLSGAALLGAGLACAGISVFAFFGCKAATRGLLKLTKTVILSIKKRFIRKADNHV